VSLAPHLPARTIPGLIVAAWTVRSSRSAPQRRRSSRILLTPLFASSRRHSSHPPDATLTACVRRDRVCDYTTWYRPIKYVRYTLDTDKPAPFPGTIHSVSQLRHARGKQVWCPPLLLAICRRNTHLRLVCAALHSLHRPPPPERDLHLPHVRERPPPCRASVRQAGPARHPPASRLHPQLGSPRTLHGRRAALRLRAGAPSSLSPCTHPPPPHTHTHLAPSHTGFLPLGYIWLALINIPLLGDAPSSSHSPSRNHF